MKRNVWSRLWKVFTHFSAIVVVVWTLIQITKAVFPEATTIVARGECFPVDIHDSFRQSATKLQASIDTAKIAAEMAKDDCKEACRDIPARIQEINTALAEQILSFVDLTAGVCTFEIRNSGTQQVDELYLDVQQAGLAWIERTTGRSSVQQFAHGLSLGSVRPSDVVKVVALTKYGVPYAAGGQALAKLTHPTGFVYVKAPYKLWGYRGWIGENLGFIGFLVVMGALCVLIFVSGSLALKEGANG